MVADPNPFTVRPAVRTHTADLPGCVNLKTLADNSLPDYSIYFVSSWRKASYDISSRDIPGEASWGQPRLTLRTEELL